MSEGTDRSDRLVRENEALRLQVTALEAEVERFRAAPHGRSLEYMQIEESLHKSEQRMRRFYESGLLGVLFWNMRGQIADANDRFLEMVGYTRAELTAGQIDWLKMTPPEYRHLDDASVAELKATGVNRVPFEKEYIRKDGSRIAITVAGAMLDEERTNGVAFVLDITERKRAEHALAASETRYRRLFEAAKDGILILDATTGQIVDVNPFLMGLTGYARAEFLGKHLWEIGSFQDIAASREAYAELRAQQFVRNEDLPLHTIDGQKVYVEFVSNVYCVDSGNVIQCNIRDITKRRRAEKRILEQHATLEAILESADFPVFSLDREYRYTAFNQAHAAVMKSLYHSHIQLGGSFPEYQTEPEDWQTARRNLDRALQGETVLESSASGTEGISRRYFEVAHHPVRTDAGEIIGVSVFARDITERKNAEVERERLEEQLRMAQRMEAIGSLAGGIAHDFNNLLSVILGCTEFAMARAREDDQLRDELLELKKASDRAAALTRQLLAFSRKQVLQPVSLDLNQIAAGVEKMLRRILGEDIDYIQVLAPDLGMVWADPGQIEQVLMNLVVNARDAMPAGGKLIIETSNVDLDEAHAARHLAVKPGPYVRLTITDTGCGMDAATQARIFEPFFTTKEIGRGTGLGLSTVYGIVKQSGGNIWVYSECGQGTTFKVYLPRMRSFTTKVTSSGLAAVPSRSTGTETILVVEDEEAIRNIAKRMLQEAGYTVLTTSTASDALLIGKTHQGKIHLLLTDVVMPQMGGRELSESLAVALPGIKVLYMSGYTDEAIVHHGTLDPGTHFIPKPFSTAELLRKVREVLDIGTNNLADDHQQPENAEAQEHPLAQKDRRTHSQQVFAKLREAVIAARYDEMVDLIETIRVTDANMAEKLRRMVDVFDYDGLRGLMS
jgi:two-component system, cell cycle sensor histidine kinase and response regulator CckA